MHYSISIGLAIGGWAASAPAVELRTNFFTQASGERVPAYDAALERYGSQFYLVGTGTQGAVWQSRDLVHWTESPDMLTKKNMPQWLDDPKFNFKTSHGYGPETYPRFGAGGLFLWNGMVTYAFNGIGQNYVSLDDFEQGTAGSFIHSSLDYPHSRGIDPEYILDRDNQLYYIRKVNAGEPHPVTGSFDYPGPATLIAKAHDPLQPEHLIKETNVDGMKMALWGEPGEAFFYDKKNFEGPKLFFARDHYYLTFVGNVMSARIGQYQIGVAIADTVAELSNEKKRPYPVIGRNFEQQLLNWQVIAPTAEHGANLVAVSMTPPQPDAQGIEWFEPDHQMNSDWMKASGGIGFPLKDRAIAIRGLYTPWPAKQNRLFIRRPFQLEQVTDDLLLRYRLEGKGILRINGVEVKQAVKGMNAYSNVALPKNVLRKGNNLISFELTKLTKGGETYNFADGGIYRATGGFQDDINGFSQPNLFRGLNGFEYWLGGKAFYNGVSGQGIERVFFYKDKMEADPATGTQAFNAPIAPDSPRFIDRFEGPKLSAAWQGSGATLSHQQLALHGEESELAKILLSKNVANHQHYYFHAGIRFSQNKTAKTGLLLWQKDELNYLTAHFNQIDHRLELSLILNGQESDVKRIDLPENFLFIDDDKRIAQFGPQKHFVDVYKNGNSLRIRLDQFWINRAEPILFEGLPASPGTVGLLSNAKDSFFDDVIFNPGFEDWDTDTRGWETLQGHYQVTPNGVMTQAAPLALAKGDWSLALEMNARITQKELTDSTLAGIGLNYQDGQQIRLALDATSKTWRVLLGAKELAQQPALQHHFAGFKHSGKLQKSYSYHTEGQAQLTGFSVLWNQDKNPFLGANFKLPATEQVSFKVMEKGRTVPVELQPVQAASSNQYQRFIFQHPVKADSVEIKVDEQSIRPFSFAFQSVMHSDNTLRMLRQDGELLIWVNRKLLFRLTDPYPKQMAQMLLHSSSPDVVFNDLTWFERN